MYVKSSNRYENSFYFILEMQHFTYLIDIEISEIFRLFCNSKKNKNSDIVIYNLNFITNIYYLYYLYSNVVIYIIIIVILNNFISRNSSTSFDDNDDDDTMVMTSIHHYLHFIQYTKYDHIINQSELFF